VNEWLQLEMNDTIAVSGNYYKIQNIEYDILNEKAHLVLISYPDVEVQSYTRRETIRVGRMALCAPMGFHF
jgi:hypothetical protein